jgi:hypothetical protein
VVIEGTVGNGAVCDVRCHEKVLRVSAAPVGRLLVPTVGQSRAMKKTQFCDLIQSHKRLRAG